jgi:hypothetical protein
MDSVQRPNSEPNHANSSTPGVLEHNSAVKTAQKRAIVLMPGTTDQTEDELREVM